MAKKMKIVKGGYKLNIYEYLIIKKEGSNKWLMKLNMEYGLISEF